MYCLRVLLFTVFLFCSCAKPYHAFISEYNFSTKITTPDYSQLNYWAAHPGKKDPSDSVVKELRGESRDSLADVFFIHPTTYTETRNGWNADINDAGVNAKTDYTTILYQASVFNQHCRVFAPRYRQAHFSAFFIPKEESKSYFDTAYADLQKAFTYYLEHENRGRPIIIAGHSQGALMAERLLTEFFDGKPLQKKLIAAYIIGWPIPQREFENIPVCSGPFQTGCFCGWRTLRESYLPPFIKSESEVSYVTNPLSWTTDSSYVSRELNKGSVLKKFNKVIERTSGARIHQGVLWINRPKFPGSFLYRARNYHIADINLFYLNMRENIEQRIFAFLGRKE